MFQQVTIIGNLGSDPELRRTPDGTPVTSFSVATNKRWTDGNGTQQERTTWFRVTAWRRLAETCAEYLSKGRQVLVVGELQEPTPWQGKKSGEWRASLELVADTVKFLGGRDAAPSAGAIAPETGADGWGAQDDEVPF
jgi:single-strand DNA-binding protein